MIAERMLTEKRLFFRKRYEKFLYSGKMKNKIEVRSKKGAFKIPWFYVKDFK